MPWNSLGPRGEKETVNHYVSCLDQQDNSVQLELTPRAWQWNTDYISLFSRKLQSKAHFCVLDHDENMSRNG